MQLDTLLTSLEYPPLSFHNVDEQIEITALAYDSRLVKPGGLFMRLAQALMLLTYHYHI